MKKEFKNLCKISINGAGGKESYSFVVLDSDGYPTGQTPSKRDIGHWFEQNKGNKFDLAIDRAVV